MLVDHSLTYRDGFSIRRLPHRRRLSRISRLLEDLALDVDTYADFGCSNGYVTDHVRRRVGARRTLGLDRRPEHFELGEQRHPAIEFQPFDLAAPASPPQADLVTCFETLEHVGDLEPCVDTLLRARAPAGTLIITVPIEIGWIGTLKFLVKLAFGYRLDQLEPRPWRTWHYALALLSGRRISAFRGRRSGWGTHFGFDYRDLDDLLKARGVAFEAANRDTTRFYVVRGERAPG